MRKKNSFTIDSFAGKMRFRNQTHTSYVFKYCVSHLSVAHLTYRVRIWSGRRVSACKDGKVRQIKSPVETNVCAPLPIKPMLEP